MGTANIGKKSAMTTKQADADLVAKKLPLVQADYESYHASSSRVMDRINGLYTWEVGMLAAFIALGAERGALTLTVAMPMLFVIGAFAACEASQRAALNMIERDVLVVEAKLQETDPDKFQQNIITWQFGNTLVARRSRGERRRKTLAALFEPSLLFWHGSLGAAFLAFVSLLK